jgi:hypothetical protein
VPWRELLRGSVQMWARRVEDLAVRRSRFHDEVYVWTAQYDPDFLGYMAGVLPNLKGRAGGLFA